MIDYLPEHFAASPETVLYQNAMDKQITMLQNQREDLFLQFSLNTATWGLKYWEQEFGVETDLAMPEDYRRSRIRAKMRGQGTTTVKMIKNLAESFTNGQVEVEEKKRQYAVAIRFISIYGIPPSLEDLTTAIAEIIPAHIAFSYVFNYLIWEKIDATAIDFATLDSKALSWMDFERGEWINA